MTHSMKIVINNEQPNNKPLHVKLRNESRNGKTTKRFEISTKKDREASEKHYQAAGEDEQKKTQLCRFGSACRTAICGTCPFAHSVDELGPWLRMKYKTQMCRDPEHCAFGSSCRFAHSTSELRSLSTNTV